MINFTNLETFAEPETTLFPQEINALLGVIQAYIDEYTESNARYGTCILDGRKYGEPARCIFRFNLAGGIFRRNFFRQYDRTSDEIAEDSINEILKENDKSRYARWLGTENDSSVETGIYRDGELEVMVFNARHGRFLFTFHAQDKDFSPCHHLNEEIYYVVAEALANLGKEDYLLQHSYFELITRILPEQRDALIPTLAQAREFFYPTHQHRGDIPELQAWREWHEPANNQGYLTLFFE